MMKGVENEHEGFFKVAKEENNIILNEEWMVKEYRLSLNALVESCSQRYKNQKELPRKESGNTNWQWKHL